MRWILEALSSSIGKKVQMAVTGLLLCGFLVAHLGGNLFIFQSQDAFNHYAEKLEANPLLPVAEIGLLVMFVVHIITGVWVTAQNRAARPVRYELYKSAGGRTPGSRSMIYSGLVVFAFLIIHVKSFRFPGPTNLDLYTLVISSFHNRLYAGFYLIAMAFLALHLSHGFQSGFKTLGVEHSKYSPLIKAFGLLFAIGICAGFAAIPFWAGFLNAGGRP